MGYFSFNCSAERLVRKLINADAGIFDGVIAKSLLDENHWPKLSSSVGRIKDKPLFICDKISLTLDDLKVKIRELKERQKVELIVIDGLETLFF